MDYFKAETATLALATIEHFNNPSHTEAHTHNSHHLITVTKGSLKIQIGSSAWCFSPNRSVLIKSQTSYQIQIDARTSYCKTNINPEDLKLNRKSKIIEMSPLFKELILYTTEQKRLIRTNCKDQHIFALIKDYLEANSIEAIQVPLPKDERALKIYQLMVDKKQFDQPFENFVKKVGASKRTLERIFQNEVGMTFSKWRQLLRLQESVTLLDQGASVAEVSEAVGYSSSSSFTHAFKNYFGYSPGQHFKK